MDLGFQSLIGIYTIFYGVCFILPSKGNLPILPCWERRYLSLRAAAQIIDILQSSNKGLSLIENNGNLSFPCNLGRKREIAQKWRWHCGAILHLECMMAIVGKKSYCHSERSLYKNLVSSSLEESVHLICHWWSKLALYVTTIYQHWTWEPQVPKMADQIKSLKKVSLLGQIRPSPSCASLSCVPKALRVRGALKAAQRR